MLADGSKCTSVRVRTLYVVVTSAAPRYFDKHKKTSDGAL